MTYKAPPLAWGPWIGVVPERQNICAVLTCESPGHAHKCFADDTRHHHGCCHYEVISQALYAEHQLMLRSGWGLLCDVHYRLAAALHDKARNTEK
jgi:hypothetical protein